MNSPIYLIGDAFFLIFFFACVEISAQSFRLETTNDSVHRLRLTDNGHEDVMKIPFRVYRFCAADINGDGKDEALVGVVKPTRFFKDNGRRIFILKNVEGRIRTLWMGSRIGTELLDFRVVGNAVRCLFRERDRMAVADFRVARFGLRFDRYIVNNTTEREAKRVFNNK